MRKTDVKLLVYSGCSFVTGLFVLLMSRKTGWFGEWYASHIFPAFLDTIGRIASLAPFSVVEALTCAAAACLAACLLYLLLLALVPLWRAKLKGAALRVLFILLAFACTIFMMLSLACTVNYSRDTFASLTGREVAEPSQRDLHELCRMLIGEISDLPAEIPLDSRGLFTAGNVDLKTEAKNSMKLLSSETELLAGYYPNPKPVRFSHLMSMANITGIYSPFTIEANYNKDVPDYLIPYTICHELAHVKGFIREDEAGFVAFLACMKSETPEFLYSGLLNALSFALQAYARTATAEEYYSLWKTIPEQALSDYAAGNLYWRQFQGKAAELSTKANDSYLKANAQEDGVKSYGRMIDLLVAEYRIGMENKMMERI
ncbi:MAG: DUF3810 domain-containing protein [Clostridiales bacterium]|nr:DUF3810 domain-containing protein [Clostridiales bacterium]